MSLLWRNKLCIALRPDRIEIVKTAQGFRPRLLEALSIPCSQKNNQPFWAGSLEAFQEYIAGLTGRWDVTVLLSNHFVRYVSVPWSDDVIKKSERLTLARICCEQIYGDLSQSWEVRLSDYGFGKQGIASAIDERLINGLKEIVTNVSANKLASIQPWLMTSFNQYKHQIKEKQCRVLIAEPDQVVVLYLYQGHPINIRAIKIGANLVEGLELLMQRESALNSVDKNERPYLITDGFPATELTPVIERKYQCLQLSSRLGVESNADQIMMALSGALA